MPVGRRSENCRAKTGLGETPLAVLRRKASSWLEVIGRKPIVLDFLPRRGGRPTSLVEVEALALLGQGVASSDWDDVLDSLRRVAVAAGFMMA